MFKNAPVSYVDSRILIVDDEPANVFLLEDILERNGYHNVQSATDSRQALPLYKKFQPDLVLLDLRMPHLDGFQVIEQLRAIENESYLPVLVLTAQTDHESRLKALKAGAKDFLVKPLDILETLCRISNMLEVRLLHNQVRDHNKSLEKKVQERTKELQKTRLQVINCLGRAGEYRDNETGMHVVRMSHFCARLALEAGFTDQESELLFQAAPMHDIGKIGIPDRILLKPGKLNPEEWEIMKTHVNIGAEILSQEDDSPLMSMARTAALHHHEKWDGTGYPGGLKGEQISAEGRIISLCDVFDALTSERPYKKAWSVDEAMEFIQSKKGTHFEPILVDKLKRILPELLEIKETFSDELEIQH